MINIVVIVIIITSIIIIIIIIIVIIIIISAHIKYEEAVTYKWDVITHPCFIFNVGLSIKNEHVQVTTSHRKLRNVLLAHALISVIISLYKGGR